MVASWCNICQEPPRLTTMLFLLLLLLHHLINEQAGTSHSPVQIQQINHTISSLPEYNWLSALRLAKQKHQKTRQIACCVHSTDNSSFGKSSSANQQNWPNLELSENYLGIQKLGTLSKKINRVSCSFAFSFIVQCFQLIKETSQSNRCSYNNFLSTKKEELTTNI